MQSAPQIGYGLPRHCNLFQMITKWYVLGGGLGERLGIIAKNTRTNPNTCSSHMGVARQDYNTMEGASVRRAARLTVSALPLAHFVTSCECSERLA